MHQHMYIFRSNCYLNYNEDIITVPKKEIFIVLLYLGIQSKIVTQQLKSYVFTSSIVVLILRLLIFQNHSPN